MIPSLRRQLTLLMLATTLAHGQASALTYSSLRAPAAVAQGQSFSADVTVTNNSESFSSEAQAKLSWDGTGLATSSMAVSIAANSTKNLHFTVTNAANTSLGLHTATITISGGSFSNPQSQLSPGVNVTSPSRLTASPMRPQRLVSQGQSLVASTTVTNLGSAAANLTGSSLTFTGSGITAVVTNQPASIAGSSSFVVLANVTVASGASLGAHDATFDISWTDATSGTPSSTSALTPSALTVQAPTALSVTSIVASTSQVHPGQTGVTVQVTVQNGATAPATQLDGSLIFADDQAGYDVTPSPSNATNLDSGTSTVLAFTVSVKSTAIPTAARVIGANVSAKDANTGQPASISNNASTSFAVASNAPSISIGQLLLPGFVLRGSSIRATLGVTNSGPNDVQVTSADLVANSSGTSSALAAGSPSVIAAGTTTRLQFDVSAALTAAPGTRFLSATVTAFDPGTNLTATASKENLGAFVVRNNPPTATAGPPQTATVLTTATFDGSASFDGPTSGASEGDPLTYSWSVVSQPAGSALTSTDFTPNATAGAARPTLHARLRGAYVIGLVVSDGFDSSVQSTTALTIADSPPVAAATTAPSIALGQQAVLDASASSDPNSEDVLAYFWSVDSVPAGSAVTATSFSPNGSAAAVVTRFTPDRPGSYVVRSTVSDGTLTATTSVSISVTVSRPIADAGAGVSGTTTRSAELNGSASTDPQGLRLVYRWGIVSTPAGSAITTASFTANGTTTATTTSFRPDRRGVYRVSLVVDNGFLVSDQATVDVTIFDTPPSVSVSPTASTTAAFRVVQLTASATDPDPDDSISYSWRFVSKPAGTILTDASLGTMPSTSFTPDTSAVFRVEVTANDGTASSLPATAEITVTPAPRPTAIIDVQSLQGGPQLIELDGSRSRDAQGLALNYSWMLISKPATATPFTSSAPHVFYDARKPGLYTFVLTVFNPRLESGSAQVTITILGSSPVANAGDDLQIFLARAGSPAGAETTSTLRLDGTRSGDPDDQPIAYSWSIVRAPDVSAGSGAISTLASFDSDTAPRPIVTFSQAVRPGGPLAAAGDFVFALTVSNLSGRSTDTAKVTALDPTFLPPSADAGLDLMYVVDVPPPMLAAGQVLFHDPTVYPPEDSQGRPTNLRAFLRLDGRESCDPNGFPIAYRWTNATPADSALPTFVPRRSGFFGFQLVARNAFLESPPAPLQLRVVNLQAPFPTAAAFVEDLSLLVRDGPAEDEVPVFATGTRIVLDGSSSTHIDPALRGSLRYLWTQTEGLTAAIAPSTTSPAISFVPATAGDYAFRLTVTDLGGADDSVDLGFVASPAQLSSTGMTLTAAADSTASTGAGFSNLRSARNAGALEVTIPARVTLTASLVGVPSGRSCGFEWRQLSGPTALLSRTSQPVGPSTQAQTSFSPTTSRVLLFECAGRIEPEGGNDLDRSIEFKRYVRVAVSSALSAEPIATATASRATIPLTATAEQRTVTLDGSDSRIVRARAGTILAYTWRQLFGPPVMLSNPFAVRTTFTAPDLGPDAQSQEYVFELTVDQQPPGDRSAPVRMVILQQGVVPPPPTAFGPTSATGGAVGGNGGCALGDDPRGSEVA